MNFPPDRDLKAYQHMITVGKETVRFFDVGKGQNSHAPVSWISGFVESPPVFVDNIFGLADLEHRVVAVENPHGIRHGTVNTGRRRLPRSQVRKANALMAALDAQKYLEDKGLI